MKHDLTMERRSAEILGILAFGYRLIFAERVDMPQLQNAGWLAMLFGGACCLLVTLPFVLVRRAHPDMDGAQALCAFCGPVVARAYAALLFFMLLLDGATISRGFVASASYAVFHEAPVIFLILPAIAFCLLSCLYGGRGVGGFASAWLRVLPFFLLIVILAQFRFYNPAWLTPILGPGLGKIAYEGLHLGGVGTLCAGLFFVIQPTHDKRGGALLWSVGVAFLGACVFCALLSMMTPAMPSAPTTRMFRLDTILSNGRTTISLQLPMVLLWNTGLLLASACYTLLAAMALHTAAPFVRTRVCVAAAGAGLLLLHVSGLADPQIAEKIMTFFYPVSFISVAAITVTGFIRGRRAAR